MTPTSTSDRRDFAIDVLRTLRQAGFVAYWAGGCVRDLLMNFEPKDFDVATNARPEQVLKLFRRSQAIGASFGVINVLGGRGRSVEVATFRSDGQYSDGRHPDSVTYATPEEDACRRDFTINGMFFDPESDTVLDFVGGQADLERKIIRAIGNPDSRIQEDKLRMLRAVRFASRFLFQIDKYSADAIRRHAVELTTISVERIFNELKIMLEHPNRVVACDWLSELDLFAVLMPELHQTKHHWEQSRPVLTALSPGGQEVRFPLAFAAILSPLLPLDAGEVGEAILTRLRASNEELVQTRWLCTCRHDLRNPTELPTWKIKRILAHPRSPDLLRLIEAEELAQLGTSPTANGTRDISNSWSKEDIDPPLLLTGDDLLAHGRSPGKLFKVILEQVRNEQLDGNIATLEQALAYVDRNWPLPPSRE